MDQLQLTDGSITGGQILPRQPLVLAYGIGVDSTAIIVGMVQKGIRPDAILFANVGGEKAETYDYLKVIGPYLEAHNFPPVTIVQYKPKNFKHWPPYSSLYENCLTNGTLPSIAFGFGSCSQKWKAAPQHKYMQTWEPALQSWAAGQKVRKAIGYDCSGRDQQRRATADKMVTTYKDPYGDLYDYWYPLQEWGWDRERCKAEIAAAGLPVPMKSSCFFCTAMKPDEVRELPKDKLVQIVLMETRAKPRLKNVEGLWRKSTKKRPGSMTTFIRQEGLLAEAEIERIEKVPGELVAFQEAQAALELGDRTPLGIWLAKNVSGIYADVIEIEDGGLLMAAD